MVDKVLPVKVQPRHVVRCPACGMGLPVLQMADGGEIAVQPNPVVPIVPARPKIMLAGPTPPQVMIRKLIEGAWEGGYGAPVFIPHAAVCPRGIEGPPMLLQSLRVSEDQDVQPAPEAQDEGAIQPTENAEEKAKAELARELEANVVAFAPGGER